MEKGKRAGIGGSPADRWGILFGGVLAGFLFGGGMWDAVIAQAPEEKKSEVRSQRSEVGSRATLSKEEDLKKAEVRLEELLREVKTRLAEQAKQRAELEALVKRLEGAADARLNHVIRTFEAMPPEEAAARIDQLEPTTAVRILGKMKGKSAAAILAAVEPAKAAKLTEGLIREGATTSRGEGKR